jgi:hypothetical protein
MHHNASAGRALLDSVAGLTKLQVLHRSHPAEAVDCHMHSTGLTALTQPVSHAADNGTCRV